MGFLEHDINKPLDGIAMFLYPDSTTYELDVIAFADGVDPNIVRFTMGNSVPLREDMVLPSFSSQAALQGISYPGCVPCSP